MIYRYRVQEGMLTWALHRLSGLGVLLFVALHILDTFLVTFGPGAYEFAINFYRSFPGRILEVILAAAVVYHAFNGLRVMAFDFWPRTARYNRQIFYAGLVIMPALFVVMAIFMLRPFIFGRA